MNFKLGLIGHPVTNRQIKTIIKENLNKVVVNSIDVITEKDIYEAEVKIKKLKCEGLLFYAEDIYHIFNNKFQIEIPSTFLKNSKQEMFRAIFNIGYVQNKSIENLSIDYVNFEYVLNTLEYLGVQEPNEKNIHIIPTVLTIENLVTEIYEKHIENHNQYNTVCITHFTEVDKKLKQMGIPSVHVDSNKEDIIKNINQLRAIKYSIKRDSKNPVVMLITLSSLNEHIIISNSEHSVMSENQRIAEEVFWFAEKLNGTYISIDSKKYFIFTDSESIEEQTEYFSNIGIMEKISQKTIMHCSIGIGYGKDHRHAMKHAYIGNIKAEKENRNASYIVYDVDKAAGPILASNNQKISNSRIYDLKLERIAEKSSLSINTIYSIYGYIKSEAKTNLSSNDIASALNITQRSANRIIAKLMDSGFISLSGQKSDGGKGRPINIYKFLI